MSKNKEKLFSVTKKDLVFEYFSGTGAGGQHKNKCQNSCRCKHPESGAVGLCQEHRSKEQNTKTAFRRMVESKEFQDWVRIEASRVTGELAEIEKRVERELNTNVKVEVKDDWGTTATSSASVEITNAPPNIPSNPSPFDGLPGINLGTDVSWSGGDPGSDQLKEPCYPARTTRSDL